MQQRKPPRFGSDEEYSTLFPWPAKRPAYTSLSAAIRGESSRWNVPGISSGVYHEGETEIQVTGTTSIETGFPVTPDTLFQIGSISKIFTATLSMRLAEQGVLDLDTTVIKWVPDLPLADERARNTVTMRHLLSHTSGFEGDRFLDYGRGDDSLSKAIAGFDSLNQWYVPGTLWAYNNAGFYLAGRVIECATGKVFEDVLIEELFKPLGLTHTEILPEYAMTRPHAVGHSVDHEDGLSVYRPFGFSRYVNAAGGIMSSASDMLRFARMHLNDGELDGEQIISKKSAKEMREAIIAADSPFRSYGVGWSVWDYPDVRIVDHGGAIQGFKAHLTLVPDRDFALVLLTNSDPGVRAYQEVTEWAITHYLDTDVPKPEKQQLSSDELDAFTGIYTRHDGRHEITVSDDGDGLRLVTTSIDEETGDEEKTKRAFDLEPIGDNNFRVTSTAAYGSIFNFMTHPGPDGTDQELIRVGGRLAKREKK